MITFVRTPGCRQCNEVSETLRELAVSHRVVPVNPSSGTASGLPENTSPPVLMDNGSVVQGHDAIRQHLEGLEDFVATWQKFQTDACYCDDEGNPE